MMCWESLDDSEQASNKRKTHAEDTETNDKADEMDDKIEKGGLMIKTNQNNKN